MQQCDAADISSNFWKALKEACSKLLMNRAAYKFSVARNRLQIKGIGGIPKHSKAD